MIAACVDMEMSIPQQAFKDALEVGRYDEPGERGESADAAFLRHIETYGLTGADATEYGRIFDETVRLKRWPGNVRWIGGREVTCRPTLEDVMAAIERRSP